MTTVRRTPSTASASRPQPRSGENSLVIVEVFDDPIGELLGREVELRFVPSLWPLRDAVVASSLEFSLIRMRNALPREMA